MKRKIALVLLRALAKSSLMQKVLGVFVKQMEQ